MNKNNKSLFEIKEISKEGIDHYVTLNKVGTLEGWNIFVAMRDADSFEIQALDDAGIFKGDPEAVRYIFNQAMNGSIIHNQVLEFMRKYAEPEELEFMINWINNKA